jgi:hypothetical protein
VSDHEEIRNLISSYSHAADDGNYEAFAANFTADGVLVDGGVDIPASTLVKLQADRARAQEKLPQPNGSKHLQLNTVIKLDGDRAQAVTDLVIIRLAPDTGWIVGGTGRYDDEIVKQNDRWLFKRRKITWHKNLSPHRREPDASA